MNAIVLILGCLGCLSVGILLGVNLVSHNNKMARKLLDLQKSKYKIVNETLFDLNQNLQDIGIMSKEPIIKEKLYAMSFKINLLMNNIV